MMAGRCCFEFYASRAMELLHTIQSKDVDKFFMIYYMKPQGRTFRQIDAYYDFVNDFFIELPHVYFILKFIKINEMGSVFYIYDGMKFFGSNKKVSGIDDDVFAIPVPHAGTEGGICVSDTPIVSNPNLTEVSNNVFNAFFSNSGGCPDAYGDVLAYLNALENEIESEYELVEFISKKGKSFWNIWLEALNETGHTNTLRVALTSFCYYDIDKELINEKTLEDLDGVLEKHAQS